MDNYNLYEYNYRTDLCQYDGLIKKFVFASLFSTVAGNVIFEKNSDQIGIKLLAGMALHFRFILKNDMEFRTSIIIDYNKKRDMNIAKDGQK